MPIINTQERVIVSQDKEPIFDISPDLVTSLRGNQIIGGVTQGNIEAATPQNNITRPLQSPNFKQGTTGWRLNSNGILEANGAIIT